MNNNINDIFLNERMPIYFNGEIQYPIDGDELLETSCFKQLVDMIFVEKENDSIPVFSNRKFSLNPYSNICNCGTQTSRHKDTCPKCLPNFHYKPTDFKLYWYERPFVDCYTNQPLNANQINELFELSIKSL